MCAAVIPLDPKTPAADAARLSKEQADLAMVLLRKAVAEADEWLQHNQPIPHEEVLAEFGLTMADWEKIGQEPLKEETPRRNG